MEPYELPFGGLFDLNRDGNMDPTEDALAYMVFDELINEENEEEEEPELEDEFEESDDEDGD